MALELAVRHTSVSIIFSRVFNKILFVAWKINARKMGCEVYR